MGYDEIDLSNVYIANRIREKEWKTIFQKMKKDIVLWMRIMIFLDNSEEIHKIIRIVSSREFDWIIEKNSRVFCFFTLIIEKERKRLRNKTIRKLNIKEKAKWKNEKKRRTDSQKSE